VGVALDDKEVAGRVEPDLVRRAERRASAAPPSPAYAFLPLPASVVTRRDDKSSRRVHPVSYSQ
jgi:hypothetical protein